MIKMIGIDHSRADVDIRSVFSIKKSEMAEEMIAIREQTGATGIVVISTCNRMEVWISGEHSLIRESDILEALCNYKDIDKSDYEQFFIRRESDEAIEHLMLMTSGLKSAIIAEDQILSQVKQASDYARQERLLDSTLDVLFRTAITAGKKIKTDVVFHRANATAIEKAIKMLKDADFDLRGKRCLVIGNGEYGRLVANHLVANGADVTVTIRQYHSGEVLIPKGCKTILYGEKYNIFPECDLVISATASPNYTLFYDKIRECEVKHDMILIDLAVPRDIDPQIRELKGFKVYDIDDFKSEELPENSIAYQKAHEIISEKMQEFHAWYDYRDMIPLIGRIKENAAKDVSARLGKTVRKLDLEERKQKELNDRIEDAAGKVVANIFYHMRDVLDENDFKRCMKAVWECEDEY